MPVKITHTSKNFLAGQRQKVPLALRFILEDIERLADPKTPRETGNLRNNKIKQVLGTTAKIAWRMNYAIYQEQKQFSNYTTGGTGPHFAENAVTAGVARSEEAFRRAGVIL
jgi:hypothetical protein